MAGGKVHHGSAWMTDTGADDDELVQMADETDQHNTLQPTVARGKIAKLYDA